MRNPRALALFLVLAAGVALAGTRTWSLSQNLTGTAPSVTTCGTATISSSDSDCGFNLGGIKNVRICVYATSGQTLSGSGYLKLYGFSTVASLWGLDQENQLTVNASGVRQQCWVREVAVPIGNLYPVPSAITVSGGTTVTTTVEGWY